jgi:photosystem II stability/assembly factor-like uncharacterized protein
MTLAGMTALLTTAATAQDPAAPEKPHAAMIAPLAVRSTLLGIAQAGGKLVAVGDRGHILVSADGKAWQQVPAPVDVMLNRVRFHDDRNGFAVGHDATILATHDGGANWSVQHYDPQGRPLYDLLFVDEQHLVAIGGYGSFFDSADGGGSWTAREFPVGALGQHFNAATTLADGSLLVTGEKGLLMRSKDRGANWELLDTPYTGSFFGALPFGARGVLVYGLRGHIYVTDDASKCPVLKAESYDPYTRETVTDAARLAKLGWRAVEAPTHESLFGAASSEAGIVLVGVNGTVVRLDPAAARASTPRPPDGETFADVTVRNGRWLAAGRRGARDLGELK